jgi:hypothetical protein
MSNGHKPGWKGQAECTGVSEDGTVSFKSTDASFAEYFRQWVATTFDVDATVAGDAGSTGDIPQAPESTA